jgi:hypothetical protein
MAIAETRLPLPLPADIYLEGLREKGSRLGEVCTAEEILTQTLFDLVTVRGFEHVTQTVAAFLEAVSVNQDAAERLSLTVASILITSLGKECTLEMAYREVAATLSTLSRGNDELARFLIAEAELGYEQLKKIWGTSGVNSLWIRSE